MRRENAYLERVGLLVGEDVLARLGEVRVLLFGAGGVGSWCAEGLVRSGVRHLTLVDADVISESNVGRQLMATPRTVGQVKVEALRDRLLEVAPDAEITVLQKIFSAETADEFAMEGYDYILDAIDSLKDKGELILRATRTPAKFFCSMGAALRKKFKQNHTWPGRKFRCVYDEEVLPNRGGEGKAETDLFNKAQINGALVHITAMFGMTLAGLVIEDVYHQIVG